MGRSPERCAACGGYYECPYPSAKPASCKYRGEPSPSAEPREFVLRLDTLIVNNLDENQQRTLRERGLTLVRVREVKDGE